MNITASNFSIWVWIYVIYIIEQNIKVWSIYIYHRLYFTHKFKKPIIKPIGKSRRNPQITLPGSDVIAPPLYLHSINSTHQRVIGIVKTAQRSKVSVV